MGRNGIMKRENIYHVIFNFICYPYMMMLNSKRHSSLTYKIEEITSNQQKNKEKQM